MSFTHFKPNFLSSVEYKRWIFLNYFNGAFFHHFDRHALHSLSFQWKRNWKRIFLKTHRFWSKEKRKSYGFGLELSFLPLRHRYLIKQDTVYLMHELFSIQFIQTEPNIITIKLKHNTSFMCTSSSNTWYNPWKKI